LGTGWIDDLFEMRNEQTEDDPALDEDGDDQIAVIF
jgi:hypothetical protein